MLEGVEDVFVPCRDWHFVLDPPKRSQQQLSPFLPSCLARLLRCVLLLKLVFVSSYYQQRIIVQGLDFSTTTTRRANTNACFAVFRKTKSPLRTQKQKQIYGHGHGISCSLMIGTTNAMDSNSRLSSLPVKVTRKDTLDEGGACKLLGNEAKSSSNNDNGWSAAEDQELLEKVPLFTIGEDDFAVTFWTALVQSSSLLSLRRRRTREECEERFLCLSLSSIRSDNSSSSRVRINTNTTTTSTSIASYPRHYGTSPPILSGWKRSADGRTMEGMLEGRQGVWFDVDFEGSLECGVDGSTLVYVVAKGGRVFELAVGTGKGAYDRSQSQPPQSPLMTRGTSIYRIFPSRDYGDWKTVVTSAATTSMGQFLGVTLLAQLLLFSGNVMNP